MCVCVIHSKNFCLFFVYICTYRRIWSFTFHFNSWTPIDAWSWLIFIAFENAQISSIAKAFRRNYLKCIWEVCILWFRTGWKARERERRTCIEKRRMRLKHNKIDLNILFIQINGRSLRAQFQTSTFMLMTFRPKNEFIEE